MPTIMTHAAVALGLGRLLAPAPRRARGLWLLLAGVAILPDLDVVAWPLGLAFDPLWGHRGISHSLAFAAATATVLAAVLHRRLGRRPAPLGVTLFVVMASHGVLDAFTNGGPGVAFLAPFDLSRHFFPWRPIVVSPIGLDILSRWGARTLWSEVRWIWLPLGAALVLVEGVRRARRGPRGRGGSDARIASPHPFD